MTVPRRGESVVLGRGRQRGDQRGQAGHVCPAGKRFNQREPLPFEARSQVKKADGDQSRRKRLRGERSRGHSRTTSPLGAPSETS